MKPSVEVAELEETGNTHVLTNETAVGWCSCMFHLHKLVCSYCLRLLIAFYSVYELNWTVCL